MTLAIERVELELVLREALIRGMLLRPHDPAREVTVDVDPGLTVLADPERLLEVLTNLVKNAVEHAGAGAKIRLAAAVHGSRVVLTVSDTGRGIPQEVLPHVFERFYRGPAERQRIPTGTGLGLAITASLIEAMRGTISVESLQGRGTTFTISLPRVEQPGTSSSGRGSRGPKQLKG
jgi:signal transduction histidine kinase